MSYSPQPLPTAVATHVAVLARRLPPTLAGHSFMSEAPDSQADSTTSYFEESHLRTSRR